MDYEEIDEIFENTKSDRMSEVDDNAMEGLHILSKYTKHLIRDAGHDVIFGPSVDDMIEAGITKEDITELARLNWMLDQESFACFV